MPRPQVSGRVASPAVQPAATPIGLSVPDYLGLARGVRSPLSDLAQALGQASPHLQNVLGALTEATKERETDAAKVALRDLARDNTNQEDFAKAVSSKLIDETQSPYFQEAFRGFAATEFASRYHVTVQERVQAEIARQRTVPDSTGVSGALAPKPVSAIQSEVWQELIRQAPEVMSSLSAQAKLGDLVAESNAATADAYSKAHEEVKREYTRSSAITGLSSRLQVMALALPGGSLDEAAMQAVSEEVSDLFYRNSIAEPQKAYLQAVKAAALRMAAPGGASLEAARRFVESAGKVKLGPTQADLNADTALQWADLTTDLDRLADREEAKDEVNRTARDGKTRDKVDELLAPLLPKLEGPEAQDAINALKAQITGSDLFPEARERTVALKALEASLANLNYSQSDVARKLDDEITRKAQALLVKGDFEGASSLANGVAGPERARLLRNEIESAQRDADAIASDPRIRDELEPFNADQRAYQAAFGTKIPQALLDESTAAYAEINGFIRGTILPAKLARNGPGGEAAYQDSIKQLAVLRKEATKRIQAIADKRQDAEVRGSTYYEKLEDPVDAFKAEVAAGIVSAGWVTDLRTRIQNENERRGAQNEARQARLYDEAQSIANRIVGESAEPALRSQALEDSRLFVDGLLKDSKDAFNQALKAPDHAALLSELTTDLTNRLRAELPAKILGADASGAKAQRAVYGPGLSSTDIQTAEDTIRQRFSQSQSIYGATRKLERDEIQEALTAGKMFDSDKQAEAVAGLARAQHFAGVRPTGPQKAWADAMSLRNDLVGKLGGSGLDYELAVLKASEGAGIHYTELIAGSLNPSGVADPAASLDAVRAAYKARFGSSIEDPALGSVEVWFGSGTRAAVRKDAAAEDLVAAYNQAKAAEKGSKIPLSPEAIKSLNWARTPIFNSFGDLQAFRSGYEANDPIVLEQALKLSKAFGFVGKDDTKTDKNKGLAALLKAQAALFGEEITK